MAMPDDWDPGDTEQSAYSNSMPDRDTRAHSFVIFYRLFCQVPPTPWVLRQSDILNTARVSIVSVSVSAQLLSAGLLVIF